MADEIRKVGIELTAQGAQEFTQSLKGIKAATSEAYSELKLAQSQYDKNTSAVDKLKDRQEYLQKVTEQYRKKSELLRGELEKAESAENRDENAIAKKRAELNQCNAKLNDYERSLKDVNNQLSTHSAQLEEWGGKLKTVGDKTTEIGKGLTTHVTAPIVAVGAASTAAWKEVDAAMDTVTTKTGASGEALEDMQQRVKNIAETIPTDFQTAADAVGEVNTRFGLTGDALEDLSSDFVKFAEINDTDVSSSIDSVQSAMAAWGIKAEDAGLVLDTMNKAGQDTGVSVDKLSDLLKTNKTALDDAGLSFSDSAMLLANLDKNGVDAGVALGGLKKAFQNAAKDGKTSKEVLDELQQKMGEGADKSDAYKTAIELFGAKAGPAIADAVSEGRLSFEELGTSLEDYAGSVGETFDATVDPMDQLQTAMNTAKDLGAEIVESAAPMIVQGMTALRDIIQDLKEKWEGLTPEQQEMILKIAGITAIIGPLLVAIGTVIGTIGTIVGAIGGVMGAIGALVGGAGIAGIIAAIGPLIATLAPFLIGGAVIAGIALAVDYIIKHWDELKQKASDMVNNIKQKFEDFKQGVVDKFNALKDGARQKFEDMKQGVSDIAENIRSSVSEKFQSVYDKAHEIFENVKEAITKPIDDAKETIGGIIDKISGLFSGAKFDFPSIKLPHFSWTWKDIGGIVSIPQISVDWYAKAYETPYLFTEPTVMRGFGDGNGGEMVYGHANLMNDIKEAVKAAGPSGTFAPVINVYTQEGQSNEAIARYVMDKLTRQYERAARYV